jgi:chromosome segregation ATPase
LEDLRKSARAGQSWHAYQAHKRHSDEKDALRAKLASVEAERDALLQRLDEAETEVQALRRGEFICGKCGLRKNSDAGPVPF